ncbi:MAG: zinc-binding dehydrogenase family oxidoreductase [Labilithrix sp.]|nr:zinc-binding dehydrogenase family oxidoreductase [Labilithrix sp.]
MRGSSSHTPDLVEKVRAFRDPNGVELASRGAAGITVEAYDGYHGRSALERLNGLVAMGPFHVEVSRTYALEETPKALADVTKHHLGKLAVTVHGA